MLQWKVIWKQHEKEKSKRKCLELLLINFLLQHQFHGLPLIKLNASSCEQFWGHKNSSQEFSAHIGTQHILIIQTANRGFWTHTGLKHWKPWGQVSWMFPPSCCLSKSGYVFATTILRIKSSYYRQITKEINTADRWLAPDVKFNYKRTQRPIPLKCCNEGTDFSTLRITTQTFTLIKSMVLKLAL